MNLGNWQLDTVDGGTLSLDGGVVFGIVPKTLWLNVITPDENNRVRLRNNCLLARDGRHVVLVDTGYGSKYGPLDRRFYEMDDGNPVLDSLARLGVAADHIDTVVFTHLHFDHAGGASHRNGNGPPVPTFTRARHVVGRLEWEDATSQAPELETAYPIENLTPLAEAGLVELIEGGHEIVPGLRARVTGGHTRGHMALLFESAGQSALFIGDVCASSAHLHRMWNLSYDTYPLVTRRVKPQLLAEAAAGNWWVFWPHDPKVAAARLASHPTRGLQLVDPRERA
jgi:glyoxylase-like metal-dependent hydrolase (beta-lactamase superfamily II)